MTKHEMEKKLAEYLDERYLIAVYCDPEIRDSLYFFYKGICAAIAQIGGWERREDGKHFVKLN